MPRFAKLGVIASMQPYHAIDDGRWAERVIGAERSETTYAFRSLLDSGARLAFGSDWFVAPPTPMEGIYAAVTRRTLDGKHPDGWVPRQKIIGRRSAPRVHDRRRLRRVQRVVARLARARQAGRPGRARSQSVRDAAGRAQHRANQGDDRRRKSSLSSDRVSAVDGGTEMTGARRFLRLAQAMTTMARMIQISHFCYHAHFASASDFRHRDCGL